MDCLVALPLGRAGRPLIKSDDFRFELGWLSLCESMDVIVVDSWVRAFLLEGVIPLWTDSLLVAFLRLELAADADTVLLSFCCCFFLAIRARFSSSSLCLRSSRFIFFSCRCWILSAFVRIVGLLSLPPFRLAFFLLNEPGASEDVAWRASEASQS